MKCALYVSGETNQSIPLRRNSVHAQQLYRTYCKQSVKYLCELRDV
jgi:hypothetical protein